MRRSLRYKAFVVALVCNLIRDASFYQNEILNINFYSQQHVDS